MLGKDLSRYAKRLSKQLDKVANVGIKIESYFHDSYQKCANLEFTDAAIEAVGRVERKLRGSAMDILRDIDKDMETLQFFIYKWEALQGIDKKTIKLAKRLHKELVQLKNHIEDTPPEMMADVRNYIMQNRY